jgi:hypothetical protein
MAATVALGVFPLERSVQLGQLSFDAGTPRFTGAIDGRPLIVDLDSSALLRIGNGAYGEALASIIEQRRPWVHSAVEHLLDKGFAVHQDGQVAVRISALDLVRS